jgi:hypothetical protein
MRTATSWWSAARSQCVCAYRGAGGRTNQAPFRTHTRAPIPFPTHPSVRNAWRQRRNPTLPGPSSRQQDRDHSLWLGAHDRAKFYVLRHVVAGPDGLHFLPSRVIRMTTVRRCRPIADDLPAVICLPSFRASYEPLDQDELASIDQPDQPC